MQPRNLALLAALAIAGGATLAITPPASAQVSIGISVGTPPPPMRYEMVPAPRPGYGCGICEQHAGYRPHKPFLPLVRQAKPQAGWLRPFYHHGFFPASLIPYPCLFSPCGRQRDLRAAVRFSGVVPAGQLFPGSFCGFGIRVQRARLNRTRLCKTLLSLALRRCPLTAAAVTTGLVALRVAHQQRQ